MTEQTQNLNPEDQVDDAVVETDESDFEIEVEDDVPEDEKPRLPEDHKADVPDDEEIEKYSESVQKRIKKLKFEYHEAERQRQAAFREREAAVEFAKQQQAEVARLRENLTKGQSATVAQAKARLETELDTAKRDYKNAYEAGDSDALLDAQQRMIRASNDLSRVEAWRPQAPQEPQQPAYQPQAQPQAQPERPQLNEQQRAWMDANPWFGSDTEMTGAAYGLHERVIQSGVAPDSEKYYAEIDAGMRKRFPEYFEPDVEETTAPVQKRASVVAPATRNAKKRSTIKLTSSQVALAKRLGLTKEQYAAQLLKDANNG